MEEEKKAEEVPKETKDGKKQQVSKQLAHLLSVNSFGEGFNLVITQLLDSTFHHNTSLFVELIRYSGSRSCFQVGLKEYIYLRKQGSEPRLLLEVSLQKLIIKRKLINSGYFPDLMRVWKHGEPDQKKLRDTILSSQKDLTSDKIPSFWSYVIALNTQYYDVEDDLFIELFLREHSNAHFSVLCFTGFYYRYLRYEAL